MIYFFLFTLLLAFATAPLHASVELSASEGTAPFTVVVNGPGILLDKAKACKSVWGSVGFSVDWGDGSPRHARSEEGNCAAMLKHTYTVPGNYVVQVAVFHPGPNDAPVFDFRGSKAVQVSGEAAKGDIRVKLLAGKEDLAAIYYGTGLRPLRFLVKTGRALDIKAEIIKEDGTLLFSEQKKVSFTGTDSIPWSKYGNGPPGEHYKNGKIRARYRITASAQGKQLAKDESSLFSIFAHATFRSFAALTPEKGKAPLSVSAKVAFHHADCISYIVDWGDGTPEETSGYFKAKKNCPLTSHTVELTHLYKKPGFYTIRWYDNSTEPFEVAKKGPGYLEKQVKVD